MNEKGYDMELKILQGIIAEILSVDSKEITLHTQFMNDLGADSLDLYQIVLEVEKKFHIAISNEDVENITTVGEALQLIKKS